MATLPTNNEEFTMETITTLPAHLLIKVESFSLLLEREIEKCESKEFEAADYKWRLIIHPNGLIKSKDDAENHISVYVAIVENDSMPIGWEVNALLRIFLHNQILDSYLCFQGKVRRFHALKTQWGFSKLVSLGCLRDPTNGFIVDDNCVFGAEVAVIKTQRVTEHVSLLKPIGSGPVRFAWKISDFSKLKGSWYSEEFFAGNHKWKVKLYPLGSGVQGRVFMYLECVNAKNFAPHEKVKAEFSLSIKNQLNFNHHHSGSFTHWFSSENNRGLTCFIPLPDMRDPKKGFIVNDCCLLEFEIGLGAIKRNAHRCG